MNKKMIIEDKNKKNHFRHKTVLEYKDTRTILLFVLITIIASAIITYVAYLFTKESDYTPINNKTIFQPGFSFVSTKYIAGALSLIVIIYSAFEIRKIHLNDKCNLKSVNSGIIAEKEFMLYLFANSTDKFCLYLFYDKIDYCIYNKKFRRLELYGEFYKLMRVENKKSGRIAQLDSLVLYDIYNTSILEILTAAKTDIKEVNELISVYTDVENEHLYSDVDVKDIIDKIQCITDETLNNSINEFYNENDSLIYAKNLDNPDKKNYFKYYLIRIIFTIICINGIFCVYWSMLFSDLLHVLKFFGDMAVVVISYKIGFCGYNSFDIHLQIRGKEFIFEEVSSVFTNKKIIHSYEFGIGDIKEIKRIPYIGCLLVMSGKFICTHDEVKVKEHMVSNYKIRFKMSRKDYYKLKDAIRKRLNCEINIKESDLFRLIAYHDWRLV